jgi:hypothetical protein
LHCSSHRRLLFYEITFTFGGGTLLSWSCGRGTEPLY